MVEGLGSSEIRLCRRVSLAFWRDIISSKGPDSLPGKEDRSCNGRGAGSWKNHKKAERATLARSMPWARLAVPFMSRPSRRRFHPNSGRKSVKPSRVSDSCDLMRLHSKSSRCRWIAEKRKLEAFKLVLTESNLLSATCTTLESWQPISRRDSLAWTLAVE